MHLELYPKQKKEVKRKKDKSEENITHGKATEGEFQEQRAKGGEGKRQIQ